MMTKFNINNQEDDINITAKEKVGSIETNFIKYALRLLQKTTDIDKSINSLLALLANLFNVDQIGIFEYGNDECDILYQWVVPGGAPISRRGSNNTIAHIRNQFVTNEFGRMFVCSDVEELPVEAATQLRKMKVKAGMCVRIADFNNYGRRYYLVCGCQDTVRHWSASEKAALCTAASIIGVYLNLKASQIENAINQKRIQSIFDSFDAYVYIVDIDTKQILYINAAIRHLLGNNSIGRICYEEFCGKDVVCENCVADKAVYDGVVSQLYGNTRLDINVLSKARLIEWDKKRRTALVICENCEK